MTGQQAMIRDNRRWIGMYSCRRSVTSAPGLTEAMAFEDTVGDRDTVQGHLSRRLPVEGIKRQSVNERGLSSSGRSHDGQHICGREKRGNEEG